MDQSRASRGSPQGVERVVGVACGRVGAVRPGQPAPSGPATPPLALLRIWLLCGPMAVFRHVQLPGAQPRGGMAGLRGLGRAAERG